VILGSAYADGSSLDLAQQYDAAKLAQDKAAEASNSNFAKKRGMVAEVKHFEEQKTEYRQWEKLRNAKVSFLYLVEGIKADYQDAAVQRHLLWRLYHITTEINESTRKVEEANEKLTGFRASVVSCTESIVLRSEKLTTRTKAKRSSRRARKSMLPPNST
jgi:structural maintenance of chromosome 1